MDATEIGPRRCDVFGISTHVEVDVSFLKLFHWQSFTFFIIRFTLIAACSCALLIPINVIYNVKKVDSKYRNALNILTIQNVDGPIL